MDGAKVRDLAPVQPRRGLCHDRFGEFYNLLCNQVAITDENGEAIDFNAERFAKRALFDSGVLGYDKLTKRFYYAFGHEINEYGNPVSATFRTANGHTLTRVLSYDNNPDGAYILTAYPFQFSLAQMIRATTDFMANCDVAMSQNLEACKTPYIVVCKDDKLRLSFEQAIERKEGGQAYVLVSEELGDGLKSVDIGVNYLVDKFAMARDTEKQDLLTKLGMLTANTDKRERVQTAEVNAGLGQATDYIYLLIDTFNKQCETYALPFKMIYNGSMEELYVDGDESKNEEDTEERENENDRRQND